MVDTVADLMVKFTADSSSLNQGAKQAEEAVKGVQQSVAKLTPEIKAMSDRIGNAAYQYGPWSGANVQMAQIVGESLVGAYKSAGKAVGAMGLALGGVAIAAGASVAIVAAQVHSLRNLDDAARAAKVSMTALQNLNEAGAGVGIDAEQMNTEMAGFAQKLREAQQSGGDLADFMKKNNIAIKDAHGNLLPVQVIFGKIAELILSSNNEMDRLAALTKIGFSGDMLRLMERQSEAVKAFANSSISAQDEVLKRGLADGEAVDAAWDKAWTQIKRTAEGAAVAVLDTIGEIEHRGAAEFDELANRAKGAFDRIAGDAKGAAAAIEKAFQIQQSELIRRQKMDLADGKNPYGDLSGNQFAKPAPQPPASDVPTIKGLYDKPDKDKAKTDRDAENAEMKGYEDSIAAATRAEKAKETLYDEGAKLHILSEGEKLAATKAALDEEYKAEKALLQKELQIDGLKLAQKQAINDKLKALDVKYNADSQKAFMQSVEHQVQQWDKMVDAMSSSLSSSIMGMIKGTETLRQAMFKIADAILQSFIKMGVDMVADWMKKQIALVVLSQTAEGQKTAAALAGAAAQTAAATTGAAAGAAAQKGAATVAIATDAGVAGAGVTAWLAPFIGPAAIGAGDTAAATVFGFNAFAVGAWDLKQDQLAMVHKGENIMPAPEASAFRSMLSGAAKGGGQGAARQSGGDTHVHNWNLSAMDGSSMKSMLSNNSRSLAKALSQAISDGNHLGLRRLSTT